METVDLTSAAFWEGERAVVLLNPAQADDGEAEAIGRAVGECDGLAGHVIFRTSGSEGAAKYACLSRQALLASAEAVNGHLGAGKQDRWLRAVPEFHVGGLGIHARAFRGGSGVGVLEGRWDAGAYAEACAESGATLSSLVPAQVHDLVREGLGAPESMRALIVGGGRLSGDLTRKARALGWPVLRTYGLTEAASQVATESPDCGQNADAGDDPAAPVLQGWDVKVDAGGVLSIRGAALFSGYLERHRDGGWRFVDPKEGGWFRTSDRVELLEDSGRETRAIRFVERVGGVVKILGELVSLGEVRRRVEEIAGGAEVAVVAVDDARTGKRLVLVYEEAAVAREEAARIRAMYDERGAGYERIGGMEGVSRIPRSVIGKVDYGRLEGELRGGGGG